MGSPTGKYEVSKEQTKSHVSGGDGHLFEDFSVCRQKNHTRNTNTRGVARSAEIRVGSDTIDRGMQTDLGMLEGASQGLGNPLRFCFP